MNFVRMRVITICVGMSLLFWGCPKAQHNARGLEQEFEPFLQGYAQGNTDSQNRAFNILALPEASNWFATYFAEADVEQLGWDYEAEVDAYKTSLLNVMKIVGNGKRFHAHCKPGNRTSLGGLQPRSDAVKPTRDVPVEQFEVEFVSEGGRKFSQLCNFVYANGAYRYVGKGTYPFWSMPDATRK